MSRERGQAAPLVAALLAVTFLCCFVLVELGTAATERARARTAADAAALAGAAEGEPAARRFAVENGGELVAFRDDGVGVDVTVVVGGARASARAERCTLVASDGPLHSPRCPPTSPG